MELRKETEVITMKEIKWINLCAFLTMVFVNILANALPLGGHTTGEVSAKYESLFTPSPFTFSIWGLIYLLMGLFILFQFIKTKQANEDSKKPQLIGSLFSISCVFNTLWIFCWQFELIGLSTILIIFLLISLYILNQIFWVLNNHSIQHQIINAGFQIYLGWIFAAAIANISALQAKEPWMRMGIDEQIWTIFYIVLGTAIGLYLVVTFRYYLCTAAITWAYIGIMDKHFSPIGFDYKYPVLIFLLLLSIMAMIVTILYIFTKQQELKDRVGSVSL